MIGNFPKRTLICDLHEALQFGTCLFSSQNYLDYSQNAFKVMRTEMLTTQDKAKHNTENITWQRSILWPFEIPSFIFRNIRK